MQIQYIYSIYDRKAGYYLPIFQMRMDADAERQFAEIVTQSDTPIAKYPADYDLVCHGHIELETGLIDSEYPVRTIVNGLVSFQAAQRERARYRKMVENPQVDLEELLADRP